MPYWKALVWFLTITSVFMSASYTMLVPFLPMYLIDELGVAQSDVNIWSGLIFSISFLISAIMAPIWGALSDKKSHKAMAVRAAVCLAISYVWGGFVQTPWELFAMRSFQGFSAGLWPACLAIMTSTAPREKMGWCLGLMQGGSTAGGVFGPLIGGVLAEVFGMRASFYFAGAALGLIALGLIFFIKGGEQKKIAPAASDKKKDKGGSFKLLKVPVIQRMLFAAAVVQLAVMLVQPLQFLVVEPVGKSLFHQGVGLRIDGLVVHRMLVRTVYTLHFEGHPAPVSGGVGEEVQVVAGAAEAGQVRSYLLVVGVGRAFIDVLLGGERLELAQLAVVQFVQLFEAYDGEFREHQQVVLADIPAVAFQVEIPAQFGRQEVVQPSGLIDALPSQQDQDFVVHHFFVQERCHHGHEPFLEQQREQFCSRPDMHLCR